VRPRAATGQGFSSRLALLHPPRACSPGA